MAYDDCKQRKPLLYADSSLSSDHSPTLSSWDSSSSSFLSDFSTTPPFGSELASGEISDDDDDGSCLDFAFELSRQMAEVMLQEDHEDGEQKHKEEEENASENDVLKASGHVKYRNNIQSNLNYGHGMPPPQMYRLRNQPPVREVIVNKKKLTSHQETTEHHYFCYGGRNNHGGQQYGSGGGSGMRAMFLGPPKSSSGTGVFLPRHAPMDLPSLKPKFNKGGCSRVLIPTRVLHALELHFNSLQQPQLPQSSINHSCFKLDVSKRSQNGHVQMKNQPQESANKDNEEDMVQMQLPHEWTY